MQEQPPPFRERARMPLRIGVVVAAYFAGRLIAPDRLVARLMLWAGLTALGWMAVDRATLWARDRSGMMVAATTILGLGLGGIGLYLALR